MSDESFDQYMKREKINTRSLIGVVIACVIGFVIVIVKYYPE